MSKIPLFLHNQKSAYHGSGLEVFSSTLFPQLGLSSPQDGFPEIIDPEFLSEVPQPETTSVIRRLALLQLSRGLEVDDPSEVILRLEKGLTTINVGDPEVYSIEDVPGFEIPLFTASGLLRIDVSPAFGILWSIDQSHPLAQDYPQLTVKLRDARQISLPNRSRQHASEISDETLALVTYPELVNTSTLTEAIVSFLKFLAQSKFASSNFYETGGNQLDSFFNSPRESAMIASSPHSLANIKIRFGKETGIRDVVFQTYSDDEIRNMLEPVDFSPEEIDLRNQANNIIKLASGFTNLR